MSTAVLLIAHGSPVQEANQDLFAMVELVRERGGYEFVEPAFLEGVSPSIPDGLDACVRQGAVRVVIIPYFLLPGSHVLEDIPELVGQARERYPDVEFVLGRHLGDHPLLAEVVRERLNEYNRD